MRTRRHTSDGYGIPDPPARSLEEPRIRHISRAARNRYANIMYDTAFKQVFGTAANQQLLIDLLECLIPGKQIAKVRFEDKEIPGFFVGDKKSVFDIFCTTDAGDTFVVEMQLHEQKYFADRLLFYSTYPVREQIVSPLLEERIRRSQADVRRKDTYQLQPVYMIGILDLS